VVKGIWFYGFAGSGKTHASLLVREYIENAFILDGDVVRELISFDLGYTPSDRKVQVKRILGLMQLAILNKLLPVASSVSMNKETLQRARELGIVVVKIERPFDQISKIRDIYNKSNNVVGKDIILDPLEAQILFNNGDDAFNELIVGFVKQTIEVKGANKV